MDSGSQIQYCQRMIVTVIVIIDGEFILVYTYPFPKIIAAHLPFASPFHYTCKTMY